LAKAPNAHRDKPNGFKVTEYETVARQLAKCTQLAMYSKYESRKVYRRRSFGESEL